MTRRALFFSLSFVVALAGCGDPQLTSDAGHPDAEASDGATNMDSGHHQDGGGADGGHLDGGHLDGGHSDAGHGGDGGGGGDGSIDGGGLDGGMLDGGQLDSGALLDASDSSVGPSPSVQIEMVRSAPLGVLSPAIHVADVMVTYVLSATGADPAGFFVQADAAGPALFVAIDPATLSPAPVPGELVSFDVEETARVAGQLRVIGLGRFLPTGLVGADPAALAQDVSSADLVAALDDYESELVTIRGTVTTGLASCGAPFVCAQLTTDGVPTSSSSLVIRTTEAVASASGARRGCVIDLGPTPLWRLGATAQPSAWRSIREPFGTSELSATSCPMVRLLSASASSSTSVVLTFDATIDPLSVMEASFTISGGVTSESFTISGSTVTLTTSALTAGVTYEASVSTFARDVTGSSVDPTANTATFTYSP